MALPEDLMERIESFRSYVEGAVEADDRYGKVSRHDRDDGSTMASRFEASESCWFEVAVRPMVPQVRVGFVTNDRWKSEEVEQAIQDSGDSMEEFVESGFSEAGLDWDEPPVEHYREADELFYFATPLVLDDVVDLDETAVRDKVVRMLEGYLIAFGPAIITEEE